jgi:4-alpha-glucanotransferase
MGKIYLILGIHNHQPVGNFDNVFEDAYRLAYKPFIDVLERHPKIKWSLHCSGILWDFLVSRHPEYMDKVRKMVGSKQVEVLTGAYYEPIIPVIPDRDKLGQIKKLSFFVEKEFGEKPRGMWLAERIWEPHLPKVLNEAGVEYTVVDDTHFAAAGNDLEDLDGRYITEEQGSKLSIFPISQLLRYYLPFATVPKIMEYFSAVARSGSRALVMADDGEKFGLWPETNTHVYKNGWLENFLTEVEKNLDWIEVLTFSEYMERFEAKGRVYLPTASYFEMSQWSLTPQAQEVFEKVTSEFNERPDVKRFLRGAFWRNFLTKYPESNNMHKKMLRVSDKVENAERSGRSKPLASQAKNFLYAGQCNCAYWHGVFGGLYLPHLRTAVYRNLIEAEAVCNQILDKSPSWESVDLDCDGREELIYDSNIQNMYLSPERGGSLFEWDLMGKKINLMNCLTRRKEAYHAHIKDVISVAPGQENGVKTIHELMKSKEKNLEDYLFYDWYQRVSLIDHFLAPNTTYDDFVKSKYGEQGDFVLGKYQQKTVDGGIELSREGIVWVGDKRADISVSKKVLPSDKGFKVSFKVKNLNAEAVSINFASEFNFSFSYKTDPDTAELNSVKSWMRKDEGFGFKLNMKFKTACDLWAFPLETISVSESGYEKTYQNTVVLPMYKSVISPGGQLEFDIDVSILEDE